MVEHWLSLNSSRRDGVEKAYVSNIPVDIELYHSQLHNMYNIEIHLNGSCYLTIQTEADPGYGVLGASHKKSR
jgi:hypothetical protein